MVRKNFNEIEEISGYKHYWQDAQCKGILVPIGIAADLALAQAAASRPELEKGIPAKIEPIPVLGGKPLPKISINTNDDIADAISFTNSLLAHVVPPALLSAKLSEDLLVSILMFTVYCDPERGMSDVLHHVIDPLWDHPMQIVNELKSAEKSSLCATHGSGLVCKIRQKNGHLVARQW